MIMRRLCGDLLRILSVSLDDPGSGLESPTVSEMDGFFPWEHSI